MVSLLRVDGHGRRGKRSTAERIVYGALDIVAAKTGTDDPVATLKPVSYTHLTLPTIYSV